MWQEKASTQYYFFSTDKAGNNETEQSLDFEIKENKNKAKASFFEIKKMIYNKFPLDIDQSKIKFPWNLGKFLKEAKDRQPAQNKKFGNIYEAISRNIFRR
jgi:hypothetical protein